jgi:hypothetical protein
MALHRAIAQGASALECESRFTWTLARLINQYANMRADEEHLRREQKAVRERAAILTNVLPRASV